MTNMKREIWYSFCVLVCLVPLASAGPFNLMANGDFSDGLNHWILYHSADPNMTAAHDPTVGNPAGSAFLKRDQTIVASNGHYFTQVVPVTVGNTYQIAGEWKGDLRATPGTEHRNWIEVFVTFSDSPDPAAVSNWGATQYKKRYDDEEGNLFNLLPEQNGMWDWESILDSPDTAETGQTYVATGPYMFVAFNLGGRAGAGEGFVWIDNLQVIGDCRDEMPADLNNDCIVDLNDFALMATDWLKCNLEPSSACWD